jgi:hypothetical protein
VNVSASLSVVDSVYLYQVHHSLNDPLHPFTFPLCWRNVALYILRDDTHSVVTL